MVISGNLLVKMLPSRSRISVGSLDSLHVWHSQFRRGLLPDSFHGIREGAVALCFDDERRQGEAATCVTTLTELTQRHDIAAHPKLVQDI